MGSRTAGASAAIGPNVGPRRCANCRNSKGSGAVSRNPKHEALRLPRGSGHRPLDLGGKHRLAPSRLQSALTHASSPKDTHDVTTPNHRRDKPHMQQQPLPDAALVRLFSILPPASHPCNNRLPPAGGRGRPLLTGAGFRMQGVGVQCVSLGGHDDFDDVSRRQVHRDGWPQFDDLSAYA